MTKLNLTNVLGRYKSGWLALSSDYKRVIAHAEKLIDLQKAVKNKKEIVIIQAASNYYNFVS